MTKIDDYKNFKAFPYKFLNKPHPAERWGMLNTEGYHRVETIVNSSKTYEEAEKKLTKLAKENGFEEATDTVVRDFVYMYFEKIMPNYDKEKEKS